MKTALEKLRRFQVENAHHYINRMLRAAYLCGAQHVEVTARARQTRVWFPKAALDPSRLDGLFEELFQGEFPAARELAGATNLALSLEPRSIELRLDDGERARILVLRSEDETEVEVVEASPQSPGTTFQLNRSAGASLTTLGADAPEYLAVSRRCRFSPLQIRLNEKPLAREVGWGSLPLKWTSREYVTLKRNFLFGKKVSQRHHVVEMRVVDQDAARNGVHLPTQRSSALMVEGGDLASRDCAFAIGLCADPARQSTATFVFCGETLQAFPAELPLPGLDLLICANGLKLDISGERLVQDQSFDELWAQAKKHAARLAQILGDTYPGPAHKLSGQVFHQPQTMWKKLHS